MLTRTMNTLYRKKKFQKGFREPLGTKGSEKVENWNIPASSEAVVFSINRNDVQPAGMSPTANRG